MTSPSRWRGIDYAYIGISAIILLSVAGNINRSLNTVIVPYSGSEPRMERGPVMPESIYQANINDKKDKRVAKLQAFLYTKKSPLAPHAETIVKYADEYAIEWTRVVAISGMESAFGTKLPEGSHNAWGLGGSKFMRFDSWNDSIEFMTKTLANNYRLNELKGIKAKYCPESDNCNPKWADVVKKNSDDILAMVY